LFPYFRSVFTAKDAHQNENGRNGKKNKVLSTLVKTNWNRDVSED